MYRYLKELKSLSNIYFCIFVVIEELSTKDKKISQMSINRE